nr:AAA family ATPase [Deltaproteobacteria bacterium]
MDGRALVGRHRELGTLDEALRRGTAGERAIVMLTGEPGIGKTRLLEELAARSVAAGGVAVWGRTWEVGLTPAYWPWIQILGALETPDERAPSLDQLDDRADASARLARFEHVASFLRRRASTQLVTLLLDDVHASDPSSLQLLEYCVRAVSGARIVIGISARDGDASKDVVTALGRIQRGSHRLPLAPLDCEAVSMLVGSRVDPAASSRVWELSEGNPLFVEELLASLATDGNIRLPQVSSVRSVIRDRVARLPETTGTVLAAAAVVGREARGAVVADMLGLTAADLVTRITPAMRLGMVAAVSADGYRFSHALVAEALADELDPSERARLHLRAAQALERRGGGEASAVAHHLLAAGHLAAEAAVGAAERAAAEAVTQLAFEDAASMLERALAALQLAAPDDRRRRAVLLAAWAEALQHAGQHARASEVCDEAAAIARSIGDGPLLARIALVRGVEWRFGYSNPVLIGALEEAAALVGDAPGPLRARLLARLAAAQQPADDPTQPVARARHAIALAQQLVGRERLDVIHIAMSAMIDYVTPDELEPILLEALALATAAGDRMTTVHTLARLCFVALNRCDRAGFVSRLEDLRARSKALGLARWLGTVELMDSLLAVIDGRF